MKRGSLGYLTREGLRNIWTNRLMSFASVCVLMSCLMMIGVSFMVFVNLQVMIDKVEEQNVIIVFIEDGTSAEQTSLLGDKIKAIDNVQNVEFVSKEDAFRDQLSSLGDAAQFFEGIDESPLPDAYKVTLSDMAQFDDSVTRLGSLDNVLTISENKDFAQKLLVFRTSVSYISLGVIALLLAVSLFIIANTIRITMFSRRLEISIMKSVGATRWFIRWPFMIEGMLLGIIAGVLSLGLVYGVYVMLERAIGSVFTMFGVTSFVPFSRYVWILLGGFCGVGVVSGGIGSLVSIGKYLKEKVYDVDERTI